MIIPKIVSVLEEVLLIFGVEAIPLGGSLLSVKFCEFEQKNKQSAL
jgi:hypothetical protein